jgi:hypothetical protein
MRISTTAPPQIIAMVTVLGQKVRHAFSGTIVEGATVVVPTGVVSAIAVTEATPENSCVLLRLLDVLTPATATKIVSRSAEVWKAIYTTVVLFTVSCITVHAAGLEVSCNAARISERSCCIVYAAEINVNFAETLPSTMGGDVKGTDVDWGGVEGGNWLLAGPAVVACASDGAVVVVVVGCANVDTNVVEIVAGTCDGTTVAGPTVVEIVVCATVGTVVVGAAVVVVVAKSSGANSVVSQHSSAAGGHTTDPLYSLFPVATTACEPLWGQSVHFVEEAAPTANWIRVPLTHRTARHVPAYVSAL